LKVVGGGLAFCFLGLRGTGGLDPGSDPRAPVPSAACLFLGLGPRRFCSVFKPGVISRKLLKQGVVISSVPLGNHSTE